MSTLNIPSALVFILSFIFSPSLAAQLILVKKSEIMVYDTPPFKECHASTIVEVTENKFWSLPLEVQEKARTMFLFGFRIQTESNGTPLN